MSDRCAPDSFILRIEFIAMEPRGRERSDKTLNNLAEVFFNINKRLNNYLAENLAEVFFNFSRIILDISAASSRRRCE